MEKNLRKTCAELPFFNHCLSINSWVHTLNNSLFSWTCTLAIWFIKVSHFSRPLNPRCNSVVRLAAKSPGSGNLVQISNTPPPKKKVAEMSNIPNILFLTELQYSC